MRLFKRKKNIRVCVGNVAGIVPTDDELNAIVNIIAQRALSAITLKVNDCTKEMLDICLCRLGDGLFIEYDNEYTFVYEVKFLGSDFMEILAGIRARDKSGE